ncbi:MAG: LysM peptidoglycan-binding domain-containing protein [Wenzhouxiangella sp.]
MSFHALVHRFVAAACILALSACATIVPQHETRPAEPDSKAVPYYLRANLEEPFDAVDQALRRVGGEMRAPEPSEPDDVDLLSRLVERFAFAHCPADSRALEWAQWFGDRPEYMARVLDRAHPWLHDITTELERRQLPGELALLPIVESAYDPFAYSHGRASGAWQFLSATAREHGLVINEWYDGRRDVFAATRAALDYLTYLNGRFEGDWNLALAAYNGGQGRVGRALALNRARNRATEWSSLPLPRETLAYVPKLHGLACLFREPERFGWTLPQWPHEPRIARVELPGPVDVVAVSALADLEITELLALNAGLNRHLTPPGGPHHLIVPINKADQVAAAIPAANRVPRLRFEEIVVRSGDTLSALARRHETSIAALREANALDGDHLAIGQRLRLPGARAEVEPDLPWSDRYAELARLQERLLPTRRFQHQVRPGESLWVIARRYSVGVDDLQRWNGLGANDLIRPGQRLLIHMEGPAQRSRPVQPVRYTVRNGDSLWLISRRLDVRLADLMRWNGLDEGSVLRPGQVLTVRRGDRA